MKQLLLIVSYYMEEICVLSFLGLSLLGVKPTKKQLLSISLIQGIVTAVVRGLYEKYNVPFGSHMLIFLATFTLIIKIICRVDWGIASAASTLGFIMIGLSESIIYSILSPVFDVTFMQIINFPFPFFVFAYGSLLPLVFLGILIYRTKFSFTQYIGNGL